MKDSRECPGPSTEATLHCPSARRVLTAGAIALAAVAPAIDPIDSPSDSANALPPLTPARADSPTFAIREAFQARVINARRPSRSAARRAVTIRPGARRTYRHPTVLVAARVAHLAALTATPGTARSRPVAQPVTQPDSQPQLVTRPDRHTTERTAQARSAAHAGRPAVQHRRTFRVVVTKHAISTRSTRRVALRGGMSAVIAYARSQVGRSYVTGGEGGSGFDCSGLTRQAYAQAGIALPHSSRAQAARARGISRGQARAGDLVVGSGHVGIYMGHGMMIDAGNHRVGVVYRKLYSGLRVERF